jgi:hypothetical protein
MKLFLSLLLLSTMLLSATETNSLSRIQKLANEIKLEEASLKNLTNGVPSTFAEKATPSANIALANLMFIWIEHDIAVSNLTIKKLELKKLKESK